MERFKSLLSIKEKSVTYMDQHLYISLLNITTPSNLSMKVCLLNNCNHISDLI